MLFIVKWLTKEPLIELWPSLFELTTFQNPSSSNSASLIFSWSPPRNTTCEHYAKFNKSRDQNFCFYNTCDKMNIQIVRFFYFCLNVFPLFLFFFLQLSTSVLSRVVGLLIFKCCIVFNVLLLLHPEVSRRNTLRSWLSSYYLFSLIFSQKQIITEVKKTLSLRAFDEKT